jgi:Dolichyl-phosphate-mannose-protein mannosyltransferase
MIGPSLKTSCRLSPPDVIVAVTLFSFALGLRLWITGTFDPIAIGRHHWMWVQYAQHALTIRDAGSFVEGLPVESFTHPFGYVVLILFLFDIIGVPHPLPHPFIMQEFLAVSSSLNETMRVIQCVFDAAAVGILSYGLARVFGLIAAAVAGLAYAVSPVVIHNLAIYMPDSLMPGFAAIVVGTSAIAWSCDRSWSWLIPAATVGLATLMRPDAVGMLPVVAIIAFAGAIGWRGRVLRTCAVLLAFAVVMSPWWWVSYQTLGSVVWLSNAGSAAPLYGIAHYGVPGPWVAFDEPFMNRTLGIEYLKRTAPEQVAPFARFGVPHFTHLPAVQPIERARLWSFVREHPLVFAETILMRLRTIIATPGQSLQSPAFERSPLLRLGWALHQPALLILLVGLALVAVGWQRGLGLLAIIPMYPLATIGLTYFETRYGLAINVGYAVAAGIVASCLIALLVIAAGRLAYRRVSAPTLVDLASRFEGIGLILLRQRSAAVWPIAMLAITIGFECYHLSYDSLWVKREHRSMRLIAELPHPLHSAADLFPSILQRETRLAGDELIRSPNLDHLVPVPAFLLIDISVAQGQVRVDFFDGLDVRSLAVLPPGHWRFLQHLGLYNAHSDLRLVAHPGSSAQFVLHDIRLVDARNFPVRPYMRGPNAVWRVD